MTNKHSPFPNPMQVVDLTFKTYHSLLDCYFTTIHSGDRNEKKINILHHLAYITEMVFQGNYKSAKTSLQNLLEGWD